MPSGLTPHQQHCVEPLVHIADFIGDPWPERIRSAITHIFAADICDNYSTVTPLLSDIRDFFATKGNPEFMLTRDLLARTSKAGFGRNYYPVMIKLIESATIGGAG